ncbi:MAG: aquaporin [Bacillales bacterium]|jgi:aquaporin Z|nr:aquaporin [Bacillales bacterium]
MSLLRKFLAELIGTCVLVLFACGVAVWTDVDTVATALAFGLVIIAMAYSIGNISGCHINPAVSLAMLIRKKLTVKEFFVYVSAQVLGAIIGATLLGLILRDFGALGGNTIQDALKTETTIPIGSLFIPGFKLDTLSYVLAFLAEIILTFVFVLTILGVTDERKKYNKVAGLVIGFTLALVHLLGLGLTGTSVNPARSIGPAILQAIAGETTSLEQIWIWILAPLAGGALAALIYPFLSKDLDKVEECCCCEHQEVSE